jgi:hypothetical protein
MANIRWTVVGVDNYAAPNLAAAAPGSIVVQVSAAVESEKPFATVGVVVLATMTGAEMIVAMRAQITDAVTGYLNARAARTTLMGATGIEVF